MIKIELNGKQISEKKDLYQAIETQLPTPDYFGKNLDALHDVLTESAEKIKVEIKSPFALAEAIGEEYTQAFFTMLLESGVKLTLHPETPEN